MRALPRARLLPAELSRRGDHVLQRGRHFGPRARLKSTIRIDPHVLGGQDLQRRPQRRYDLLLAWTARRVDVVDTGADAFGVARVAEDAQQLPTRARILDGQHVGIQRRDGADDIVEGAVAHVGVDLGGRARPSGRHAEGRHGPGQVRVPLAAAQRQPLAQRWLIDLNRAQAGPLQIGHLVLERQRDLPAGLGAWLVVAHEGPVEDRHRAGQHRLDWLVRERLRVDAPAHGHRARALHVAVDDRWPHVARAEALGPAVMGEAEAGQLLAKVLHHVVALELAVHQHVEPQRLLPRNGVRDGPFHEPLVLLLRDLAGLGPAAHAAYLWRLREGANRRRRQRGQAKPLVLQRAPLRVGSTRGRALLCQPLPDRAIMHVRGGGTLRRGYRARRQGPRDGGTPLVP